MAILTRVLVDEDEGHSSAVAAQFMLSGVKQTANDDDATFIQYDYEAVCEISYECYLQSEHFKPSQQYMFVFVFVVGDLEPSH